MSPEAKVHPNRATFLIAGGIECSLQFDVQGPRADATSEELKADGRWIKEDVAYIITEEERQAFAKLNTEDERQNFIEQFWIRRDPTPDTAEMLHRLHARFVPHKIVMLVGDDRERKTLAGWIPVIETMGRLGGKATAYVCENYTCKLPTAEPAKFAELIQ